MVNVLVVRLKHDPPFVGEEGIQLLLPVLPADADPLLLQH